MRGKITTVVILSMCCCLQAEAQQEVQGTLTFRQAVNMGLENNVALTMDRNQLAYTRVNKASSMLQMGPAVNAFAGASRVIGNTFIQNTGESISDGVTDGLSASIDAQMPIFNGLGQMHRYKQANSQNEAQLYQVARSTQDVIRDVARQYLQCLMDEQLVKINRQNVETRKKQYEQIEAQVDLGSMAEADLYTQEYQVKNAELLLVRAKNRLRNDMALLAQIIQVDPAELLELEQPDWDFNTLAADTLSLENMYAVAVDTRSDLKQASYAEDAAHFGYSATKGRYYPSLTAGASFGSGYNYRRGDINRSFDEQFNSLNKSLRFSLSLRIPIYSALSTRSQTAFSRVSYENAKVQHKAAEVAVKADVLLAYQNFKDAVSSYEASQAQLRAAELSFKTEQERYFLSISDVVQLSVANQSYVAAQSDYQGALFTMMFQKLLVNYALGTLKVEDIPE